MGKRIVYLDIAKGILILIMLLHHIVPVEGCIYPLFGRIMAFDVFYGPFFMSAFFIISGYTSNFDKRVDDMLLSSIKGILIPAFFFSIVNVSCQTLNGGDVNHFKVFLSPGFYMYPTGFWFFAALFEARLIICIINKVVKNSLILLLFYFIVGFGGLVINKIGEINSFSSLFAYQQAMMALPFLYLGHILNKRGIPDALINYGGIIYWTIFLVLFFVNKPTPGWSYVMAMKPVHYPFFIIMAITGTMFVLWISKKIISNPIVEYIGKNSLIFYGLNFAVLDIVKPFFVRTIGEDTVLATSLFVLVSLLSMLILLYWFSYILNTRYMKIFLGKF